MDVDGNADVDEDVDADVDAASLGVLWPLQVANPLHSVAFPDCLHQS